MQRRKIPALPGAMQKSSTHGGGAKTSRLPLGCTDPTTPAVSISSTSRAARL